MILVGSLINNLIPYTADQTVVQRYMSTATEAQARRAIWLNAALAVPSGILFLAIGTVLYVYYKEHPDELHPLIADDSILPYFVSQKLPIGFSGFVVAGLFAAAQSTISSSFNSVATAVGSDFVLRLRPRLSEIVQLRIARAVTVVLGACVTLAALAMAAFDIRSLWDASVTLMSLTGSGIAALFALGIFAPRISASAAACGLAASAVLLYWITKYTTVHFFLYGCIGFGTCWLVAFGASVFLPQRRDIADLTWRGIRFE
jgi:Na+/proline symporter